MRNVFLIFLALFIGICTSCRSPKTPKEQLTQDLLDSQTFKDYVQFCVHLTEGMKTNRYNNSKVNRYYIGFHNGKNLHAIPKKELYAVYTSANMTNARDYIDTQLNIDSTYQVLLKEFPALEEMPPMERFPFLITVRKQMSEFKDKK